CLYRANREQSISSSRRRVVAGLVEVYRAVGEQLPISDANRVVARDMLRRYERDLAALDGGHTPGDVARRWRWRIGAIVHRLLGTHERVPPTPELVAAFPEIFSEWSGSA